MTAFKLLLTGLKIINLLARWVRDQGLIDRGKQLQLADSLKEIAKSAGIAREIEAETDEMSTEQIVRDLDGHGEFRD